jgi:hypothetical protein
MMKNRDIIRFLKMGEEDTSLEGLLKHPNIRKELETLARKSRQNKIAVLLDIMTFSIHFVGMSQKQTFKFCETIAEGIYGLSKTYPKNLWMETMRSTPEIIEENREEIAFRLIHEHRSGDNADLAVYKRFMHREPELFEKMSNHPEMIEPPKEK